MVYKYTDNNTVHTQVYKYNAWLLIFSNEEPDQMAKWDLFEWNENPLIEKRIQEAY